MKTLLIVTKNNRCFLTKQENLPNLTEFVKTFGCEVYLAKASNAKILDLKQLVAALCDQEYNDNPDCVKIEKLYPRSKRTRKEILQQSYNMRKYIRSRILAGKVVSLKELKEQFKEYQVTTACVCNHLTAVRKTLLQEGKPVVKLKRGEYRLVS